MILPSNSHGFRIIYAWSNFPDDGVNIMMRFPFLFFAAAAFLAAPALSATALAADIAAFPLNTEEAPTLQITIDRETKAEGEAALKISTPWPTTVPLAQVDAPGVEKTRLTYSAKVKSELGEDAQAYLEMWCVFKDGQYFSRGLDNPVTGTADWTELSTPFFLKEGQTPEKVKLNIVIVGEGTVWVDDIHLTAGPLD